MADAIQSVYVQQRNHTLPSIFNELDEPAKYIQPQDVSHRAVSTNKNQLNYSFVKCISKPGGVQIQELPKLYERNRQYPFWLSSRGNGIDCRRTWEALHLDIIPIVWNTSLNVLYENLPIVIINHYEELNEKFLYEKLKEISENK